MYLLAHHPLSTVMAQGSETYPQPGLPGKKNFHPQNASKYIQHSIRYIYLPD